MKCTSYCFMGLYILAERKHVKIFSNHWAQALCVTIRMFLLWSGSTWKWKQPGCSKPSPLEFISLCGPPSGIPWEPRWMLSMYASYNIEALTGTMLYYIHHSRFKWQQLYFIKDACENNAYIVTVQELSCIKEVILVLIPIP